jgi:hypothetical protein
MVAVVAVVAARALYSVDATDRAVLLCCGYLPQAVVQYIEWYRLTTIS